MADDRPNLKDDLLNELSSSLGPSTADLEVEVTTPPPPVITDHTLLRRIGKGSYGEVWLARNALGTLRAIKIVHRRAFDSDRPYEREFAGIRRFEPISRTHPSQLNVLQVGRDDAAGHFYYVMELADNGERQKEEGRKQKEAGPIVEDPTSSYFLLPSYFPRTLRSELQRRGRLPCEECLQIGLALATALDHLHRHGLVHRDIKPSNIVFVNDIPKLADIGLVTHVEATLSFVGTEGYLPPEGPGTPQADIYSLGKVLYEMATGRDRQDYPELPTNLIETPAADRAALAELNEVIVKACHLDAKQRYQTAAELHADLALLQSGKSVSRMRTIERRLQFVVRAGALVTAAALLTGGAWLWQQRQTRQARELARQNRLLAEEKTSLAAEKTRLADTLTILGEENRNRIVRLDIANGIGLLDEGDPAGALLWFADALPLLTNHPAEESIHRIRIQQTLDHTPKVVQVFPHESGVLAAAFSPDGQVVATGTKEGKLRLWDAGSGEVLWGPIQFPAPIAFVRFSLDGRRLFSNSSAQQGTFQGTLQTQNFFAVVDALTGRQLLPAGGAEGQLLFSAFSPDDRWLAAAESEGRIRVVDLESGVTIAALNGHPAEVGFLSFSADGNLLASASLDGTAQLWRLPSGEAAGPPLEHQWPVVRVVVSDRGRYAVTVSMEAPGQDGGMETQVWDLASGRRVGEPIQGRDRAFLAVSPESVGQALVEYQQPMGVRAFGLGSGVETSVRPELSGLQSWGFSRDGSRLALGYGDRTARLFDSGNSEPITAPFRHGRWGVTAVQFSPDEGFLLTGCEDGSARIWDLTPVRTESIRQTVPGGLRPDSTPRSRREFGRSTYGLPILVGDGGAFVMGEQLEELRRFAPPEPGLTACEVMPAPDGNAWLISYFRKVSGEYAGLALWLSDDRKTNEIKIPHDGLVARAFTTDSRQLVTAGADRCLRFWQVSDGSMQRAVDLSRLGNGHLVDLDPASRTALWKEAAGSGAGEGYVLRFVDWESGEFTGKAWEASPAAFDSDYAPDGKRVAILDARGSVTVVEVPSGRVVSPLIRHPSTLTWVQWDPAGGRILTMGDRDEVLIWDIQHGTQAPISLRSPGSTVMRARWSPDGRFVVTIGIDRRVRVWDAVKAELVAPPIAHAGAVAFAVMTAGQRLISASYADPHVFRAWDLRESSLAPDVLGDYAKMLSGRRLGDSGALVTLTPEELVGVHRSLRACAPDLFD